MINTGDVSNKRPGGKGARRKLAPNKEKSRGTGTEEPNSRRMRGTERLRIFNKGKNPYGKLKRGKGERGL